MGKSVYYFFNNHQYNNIKYIDSKIYLEKRPIFVLDSTLQMDISVSNFPIISQTEISAALFA